MAIQNLIQFGNNTTTTTWQTVTGSTDGWYTTGGCTQRGSDEPETAVGWLDDEVGEMCEKGREELERAA